MFSRVPSPPQRKRRSICRIKRWFSLQCFCTYIQPVVAADTYRCGSTLEGAAEGVVYEEVGFIGVLCSVFASVFVILYQ